MTKKTNTPDEIVDGQPVRRVFSGSIIKSIDEERRKIEFIISTESADRYKDIIRVKGWDLKNYKKNPVVLFGHNSRIPPIGKASNIKKDTGAGQLLATAEFMPADMSAFADSIFRMYVGKYLRATSVGFMPIEYEWMKDEDGDITGGIDFKKSELLEFSCVPIPANPEALVAAKSAGIDVDPFRQWSEDLLDNWQKEHEAVEKLYGVNRHDVELIQRRASGSKIYRVPPDEQDRLAKRNLELIKQQKAAKAKSERHEIEVGETTLSLPYSASKDFEKVGQITIAEEEVNGKKTFLIEEAAEVAEFTKSVVEMALEDEDGPLELETRDGEKGDIYVLTMKGTNLDIEYELVGMSEDGETFFGIKSAEAEVHLTDDELAGKDKSEDEDEEDDNVDSGEKSGDDETDDDDDDDDDDDSDDDDDEEDDDDDSDKDANKGNMKKQAKGAEDDDVELTFKEHLDMLETVIMEFEQSFDDNEDETKSRHTQRKLGFVASCMRDLADRLDGGVSDEPGQKQVDKNNNEGNNGDDEQTFANEEELTEYINDTLKEMVPALKEIIADKVRKAQGRLD